MYPGIQPHIQLYPDRLKTSQPVFLSLWERFCSGSAYRSQSRHKQYDNENNSVIHLSVSLSLTYDLQPETNESITFILLSVTASV